MVSGRPEPDAEVRELAGVGAPFCVGGHVRSAYSDISPNELGWTPDGQARIAWSDGHESIYAPALLRKICPCAECRGTHGGPPKAFKILSNAQVRGAPRQIIIERVEPIGNYAIAFTWGDGHKEGIYTWAFLRDECPCDVCTLRRRVEVPNDGRP